MSTGTKQTPRLPPDERFWQRYSPHHEIPFPESKSTDLDTALANLAKDADKQANKEAPKKTAKASIAPGTGNTKGAGGVGVTGSGLGRGKKGTGVGGGGEGGPKSKAEIY